MKRIDVYTSANCGPCRLIKPFLEELEGVDLNYIDLETKRVAFEEYGVRSTPTLIFFKNGTEYNRHVGFASKTKLQELL
jgi:thioredoxin 1